jgi:hypothetical protein
MTFQTQVNIQPAPAAPGDFASANPRATSLAGPNQLVAGVGGCTIGMFGWLDSTGTLVTNAGTTVPNGFVHNDHSAFITQYLGQSSMLIPEGFPVTMFIGGDFWVVNTGAAAATPGMKAFAVETTGAATFAATGTVISGEIETQWFCRSTGNPGELVKISSLAIG